MTSLRIFIISYHSCLAYGFSVGWDWDANGQSGISCQRQSLVYKTKCKSRKEDQIINISKARVIASKDFECISYHLQEMEALLEETQ